MAVKIQFRRGTAAEWTAANPVLAVGEAGYETDTGKFKVGDGVTTWSSLPYSSGLTGNTGNIEIGTVTTGAPKSTATVTNSGNGAFGKFDFSFPGTSNVFANNTITVAPRQSANVNSFFYANNDVGINFYIPRNSNIYANNVITVAPRQTPNANVFFYTNNDVAIDFYLPRVSNIYGNNIINVQPSQAANANVFFYTNNDVAIDFYIPRSPNLLIGTVTTGAPVTEASVTPTTRSNGDVSIDITIPRGNVGNYNPKSISISNPIANDEFTIFYTDKALTLQNVITLTCSQNTAWANSTVNCNVYHGGTSSDRWWGSGTVILQNLITGNYRYANANTTYSTSSIPANTWIFMRINSVVNAPAEFHMTLQFVN